MANCICCGAQGEGLQPQCNSCGWEPPPSPYCTSTALVAVLGRVRCDLYQGHEGWHCWRIEWKDAGGHIAAIASTDPAPTIATEPADRGGSA